MINVVPRLYTEPKWVAYVTPEDKAFAFQNGATIRSLLELKQALATLPEDEIMAHIKPGHNDIAIWISTVLGDKELAAEIEKYNHRWGMIVALERQMMRTLNLPNYVAKRWLADVVYPFTFVSGEVVKNLKELADALAKVSDETVNFHQERVPNDIAKWVTDITGDYELGEILVDATHRDQMKRAVEDHLEMLKDAAED